MDREATTSVTHLVKQIAEETMKKPLDTLTNKVYELQKRLDFVNNCYVENGQKIDLIISNGPYQPDCETFERIRKEAMQYRAENASNLLRAGLPWNDFEDDAMIQEFKAAITKIAEKHQRSYVAIMSRLRDKGILQRKSFE